MKMSPLLSLLSLLLILLFIHFQNIKIWPIPIFVTKPFPLNFLYSFLFILKTENVTYYTLLPKKNEEQDVTMTICSLFVKMAVLFVTLF